MEGPTLQEPAVRPLTGPSPSRSNPFARAPSLPAAAASFSRSSLLPSLASPAVSPGLQRRLNPFATPSVLSAASADVAVGSASKGRNGWRLLWRGGLEIGQQGYRLEGVTIFAQLQFPSTPTEPGFNPFDVPKTATSTAAIPSPLHLRGADTDICLSLESMRGRKYLQIRGVVDLPVEEALDGDVGGEQEGSSSGAQVQMSIAPTSLLLTTYFTNHLCRDKRLSPTGRTRRAIELGLGDDTTSGNVLLIYGQAQDGDPADTSRSIRLMVGRRKPPPSAQPAKVRPGEPLPRAPLFFPSKAPAKAPPPFPNRDALSKSRSFQRATSVSSIYAPPPAPPAGITTAVMQNAEVGSGKTPGRRGEKRKRDVDKEEDRRRRAGKIVPSRLAQPWDVVQGAEIYESVLASENMVEHEDIFGSKPPVLVNGTNGLEEANGRKRGKVPQQILDNKAVIRKQTLIMLEQRGYARQHDLFKDVFAMTTNGVYFVCRDAMPHIPIKSDVVQHFITRHLDMYLPSSINDMLLGLPIDHDHDEYDGDGGLNEVEVKEEEAEEVPHAPTSDSMGMPHRRRTMDSVVEEDEEDA